MVEKGFCLNIFEILLRCFDFCCLNFIWSFDFLFFVFFFFLFCRFEFLFYFIFKFFFKFLYFLRNLLFIHAYSTNILNKFKRQRKIFPFFFVRGQGEREGRTFWSEGILFIFQNVLQLFQFNKIIHMISLMLSSTSI